MPSLAYSILKFDTIDDFIRMKKFLINEQGEVDFNTISPVPVSLEIPAKPNYLAIIAAYYNTLNFLQRRKLLINMENDFPDEMAKVKEFGKQQRHGKNIVDDETIELGKQYYENMMEYKVPHSLAWSEKHRGIKGNAMDTLLDEEKLGIHFSNAWEPPNDLIYDLFKETEIPFTYRYTNDEFSFYGETVFDAEGMWENDEVDSDWVEEIFGDEDEDDI